MQLFEKRLEIIQVGKYHMGRESMEYDVVIVGAGPSGLATRYYLGKNHGITNVAVLEKGWLGGGNTGRNTTIIRSNYLQDPSAAIYEKSRSLYENPRRLKLQCNVQPTWSYDVGSNGAGGKRL